MLENIMSIRKVAYGVNRSDRDFRNLGVPIDKIFIDNKMTGEEEKRAMFAAIDEGVVVVVLSMGDFGKGAGAKRFKDAILAKGATIEGPDDRDDPLPRKSGRRGIGFTPEQVDWACALWLDPLRSERSVLARIKTETEIEANRDQMNYLCRRKPKLKASKAIARAEQWGRLS